MLQGNSGNYSLDGSGIAMKTTSYLNLAKERDRDVTDVTEIKSGGGARAVVTAADMSFSTFSSEMKLPQFPVMSAIDATLSVENELRGSVTPRYPFDRKWIRSPSPTSSSVFFGNADLLANRIGQFYPRPVPHVFQPHHLSKNFHPWHPDVGFFEGKQMTGSRKSPRPTAAAMHNFMESSGGHAGGNNASGSLNLSTNQYHQTQVHLIHHQPQQHHHPRPN